MEEKKVNEAAINVVKSLQEANETIAESTIAAQERNLKYVQSTVESGVEVLKNQAERTLELMKQVVEQSQKQPAEFQPIFDSAVAAQEHYLRYAQSSVVNGLEVLKNHAESTQALIKELETQTRKQQEALQGLVHESSEMYKDFFRSPFTYYQQALNAVESATRQSMEAFQSASENFQKSTKEGLDAFQKYAQEQAKQADKTKK